MEIRIPPGKGITCGILRAGGSFGKNSEYILLIRLKIVPCYHEQGGFYNLIQVAACFFENRLNIPECLPGLIFKKRGQHASDRINAGGAGKKNQVS